MKKSVCVTELTLTIREDRYKSGFAVSLKRELLEHFGVAPNDINSKQYMKVVEETCTLRDYIKKHSVGAYHHFRFKVMGTEIDVIGIEEFERIYNPRILDEYVVVDVQESSVGNDCCNYQCFHDLTIDRLDNRGIK